MLSIVFDVVAVLAIVIVLSDLLQGRDVIADLKEDLAKIKDKALKLVGK